MAPRSVQSRWAAIRTPDVSSRLGRLEGEDGEVLAAGAEIDELFAREEELAQCRHAVLGEAERPTHGQQASWGELTAVVMKFRHVSGSQNASASLSCDEAEQQCPTPQKEPIRR